MPTAMVPMSAIWRIRLLKFRAVRK